VIVRARYRQEASALVDLGATIAVAEEFEASLEVLTQLLARLQVPGNAVEMLLEGFRRPTPGGRPVRAVGRRLEDLSADLGDIPIATHQLHDGEWAAGRTVSEIDLRAQTGALIIAVRHDSQNFPSPPPALRLDPGDILYLMGPGPDIVRARRRLATGSDLDG
jgi:CPA2 family monovalent cation:H+ antiporter-2